MIRHQTTRRSVLAAAVVGALALSLSACSGPTSSPSPSGSSGGVYQDPDYGFEVTVAPGFAQGSQHNVEIGAAGNVSAARNVMFYDTRDVISHSSAPSGLPGGSAMSKQVPPGTSLYPATFTVSVFPLGESVTAANLGVAKTELEQHVIAEFEQDGVAASPLKATTVAGRPAFTTDLTQEQQPQTGMSARTTVYWVFADSNEYQITEVAPSAQWKDYEKPFAAMLSSVVLPGTWESASPSASPSSTASSSPSGSPSP